MFTVILFLGLGISWWFRLLPDVWVYVLAVPVCLMAFSSAQRKYMFWRAGAKCEDCGNTWESGRMLEFHHKLPLGDGGTDDVENGVLLDIDCHAHRHDELAYEANKRGDKKSANQNAWSARQIRKRSRWRRGWENIED